MDTDIISPKIGSLIRKFRSDQHLSQEELAAKCNLHRTYIGSVERGEKNITIVTALKIIDALNISITEFFSELEENISDG